MSEEPKTFRRANAHAVAQEHDAEVREIEARVFRDLDARLKAAGPLEQVPFMSHWSP